LERHVTVFLHLGDKLMPKSFLQVPTEGETILVGEYGRLTVTRVELDGDGDTHLYVTPPSEG
jgi:hypothetical protein